MSHRGTGDTPHVPSGPQELLEEGGEILDGGGHAPIESGGLRQRAARGVVINSAFQIGFACINVVQRFAVAAFLTTTEFGVWGLVLIAILTLSSLKQVGIADKFVQQREADQELAFQKAFTLELFYTLGFCVLIGVFLPLYSIAYGRPEILLPSLVLSLALIGAAFSTPTWIYYREMRFVRQRLLDGINPVVSTAVMVPMAAAGAGYWSLVVGALAGTYVAAAAAVISSPYKLRIRFDKQTFREYVGFSWPLLVAAGSGLIVIQGSMLVSNYAVGLAGVGAITLASSLIVFAERIDRIISSTIYPAVCAVKDQTDVLFETFVKSNRLALMWGLPFGLGMLLFAPQLVDFVLGDRWEPAVSLLQGLGLIIGIRQLGFNWAIFFQARGETRPVMVGGLVALVTFAVGLAPLIIAFGLDGYVMGMGVVLVGDLAVRIRYLRRIFPSFNPLKHTFRAFIPSLPAVALVLVLRAVGLGGDHLAEVIAEFSLYVLVTAIATMLVERRLLREVLGYIRGKGGFLSRGEPGTDSATAAYS